MNQKQRNYGKLNYQARVFQSKWAWVYWWMGKQRWEKVGGTLEMVQDRRYSYIALIQQQESLVDGL